MQQISDFNILIQNAEEELKKARAVALSRRIICQWVSLEQFLQLLVAECRTILLMRGIFDEYVIDTDNEHVIRKLFQYLKIGEDFKGDHNKGLFLMGGLGTGKTVLLRGFANVVGRLCDKNFKFISAFDLSKVVVSHGTEQFSKVPLLIDDLGKEVEIVKDYGTECRPIIELFASRYDNGAMTFVTTNYKMATFANKYGEQTVERFRQMFNFLELTGKSRR